jgi:hypothetical protein
LGLRVLSEVGRLDASRAVDTNRVHINIPILLEEILDPAKEPRIS